VEADATGYRQAERISEAAGGNCFFPAWTCQALFFPGKKRFPSLFLPKKKREKGRMGHHEIM